LWYNPSGVNIQALRRALSAFGFLESDLPAEVFTTLGNICTFGIEPVRVDLLNEIPGVQWESAWRKRVRSNQDGLDVNFICKEDLILNKRSTSRPQDQADAQELSAI
jgi:hypothetical protein